MEPYQKAKLVNVKGRLLSSKSQHRGLPSPGRVALVNRFSMLRTRVRCDVGGDVRHGRSEGRGFVERSTVHLRILQL